MKGGDNSTWFYAAFGILLIVFGYMLWVGNWSLNQTIAAVLVLWGAKKLACSCGMVC